MTPAPPFGPERAHAAAAGMVHPPDTPPLSSPVGEAGCPTHPPGHASEYDPRAKWDNDSVSNRDATPASVRVLGAVCGVTPEGTIVEVPSASQRRLLGIGLGHRLGHRGLFPR